MFDHSFHHGNLMSFFDWKHNRPPGTKPAADPMCRIINLVPLLVGFWEPVDKPSRNAILLDVIVVSIQTLFTQSPVLSHV